MKFNIGDKVAIVGNELRPGTVTGVKHNESEDRPYLVNFEHNHGQRDHWYAEEHLVSYKKGFRFKLKLDPINFYNDQAVLPKYLGRSYSDLFDASLTYHLIPFNFLFRYMRYLYYAWIMWTRGPECFVIMDRNSYQETLRAEYERGRERADEWFKQEVQQAAYRRN
jgi:hypothetical protein